MHFLSLVALALLAASPASSSSLPTVDLGYEIHQAISFNQTGQTYNFSNIRYAQPPLGELRFKAPVPPTGRNTKVQTGAQGRICPESDPFWGLIGEQFSAWYAAGNYTLFNLTAAKLELATDVENLPPPVPNPEVTEDCLFLDVFVPKKVYENRNKKGKKAPVLLWIFGGGYVSGSKTSSGNPSGLIHASQAGGGDGVVFVQINYRLGALGWMAGPTLEAAGGVSNAGLYDQRLAIEWVAKYAHLFGGDGKDITVIGESAGGGSIMHQITAFGGKKGVSFQRAIAQSPGWLPLLSHSKQENNTADFLAMLNVSTIAEARELPSAAVINASDYQTAYSTYGSFTFGPAVDGKFVPANPGVLLSAGKFAKDVKIMAGHNTNEGVAFTDPSVRTDAQLETYLATAYPGMGPSVITYITKTLYPADYDGSMPYTNAVDRFIFLITESIFSCNTNDLARAFKNNTYAYEFEVFPALHANDLPYTFYNGGPSNLAASPGPLIAPLAKILQAYITNFAMTGDPNGKGVPDFPLYGKEGMEVGLNVSVSSHRKDPTDNPRCVFWQKSLFD